MPPIQIKLSTAKRAVRPAFLSGEESIFVPIFTEANQPPASGLLGLTLPSRTGQQEVDDGPGRNTSPVELAVCAREEFGCQMSRTFSKQISPVGAYLRYWEGGPINATPHSWQSLFAGGFATSQHSNSSCAPQSPQNVTPKRFSCWQRGHCIRSSTDPLERKRSLVSACGGTGSEGWS